MQPGLGRWSGPSPTGRLDWVITLEEERDVEAGRQGTLHRTARFVKTFTAQFYLEYL